jgi:excisionase family DNA binding protein
MITKDEILAAGTAALSEAFERWLNDNRQEILRAIAHQVAARAPEPKQDNDRGAPPPQPYLTTKQLAARWGCCVTTVRRKIASGALTCLMMNRRHILIPIEAVTKFEKDATVH